MVGVVVNKPGTNSPVQDDIVEDALHQTLQEDGQSDISSLTLGVVNTPTVSETQQNNAARVTLINTNASQVLRELFSSVSYACCSVTEV